MLLSLSLISILIAVWVDYFIFAVNKFKLSDHVKSKSKVAYQVRFVRGRRRF